MFDLCKFQKVVCSWISLGIVFGAGLCAAPLNNSAEQTSNKIVYTVAITGDSRTNEILGYLGNYLYNYATLKCRIVKYVSQVLEQVDTIVALKPDFVMINTGFWDIGAMGGPSKTVAQKQTMLDSYAVAFNKALDQLHQKLPNAKLGYFTSPKIDSPKVDQGYLEDLKLYNAKMSEVCASRGIPICDIYKANVDSAMLRIDPAHYDTRGKLIESREIVRFIRRNMLPVYPQVTYSSVPLRINVGGPASGGFLADKIFTTNADFGYYDPKYPLNPEEPTPYGAIPVATMATLTNRQLTGPAAAICAYSRQGDFGYRIRVRNGAYYMQLLLAETGYVGLNYVNFPWAGQRTFDVLINGRKITQAPLDLGVSPGKDKVLAIRTDVNVTNELIEVSFVRGPHNGEMNVPVLNGLELSASADDLTGVTGIAGQEVGKAYGQGRAVPLNTGLIDLNGRSVKSTGVSAQLPAKRTHLVLYRKSQRRADREPLLQRQ